MARKSEQVELDGTEGTFTINQLPGEKSYYLLLDILAMVAPGASRSLKDAPGLDLGKLDIGVIGDALGGMLTRENRTEVKRITDELFAYVEWTSPSQGKLPVAKNLSAIFDNPLGIFMLQKEVLRVNYGPFLKGLGAQFKGVAAAMKGNPSVASAISGGPSGDSSPSE